jgi:hypothetical protein
MLVPRGGCRPLQPTRSTPSWHRRQAIAPAGFGLLPVRSPLLRESSLFLGVLRCFSSPGALVGIAPHVPGRAPGGLPHSDIPGSPAASASPGHFAAWPRPSSAANAKASTMRPSCGYPAPSPPRSVVTATADRHAPAGWSRRPHPLPRRHDASWRSVWFWCLFRVCVYVAVQCARASRHEPPRPTGLGATSGSGHVLPHAGQTSSRGRRTQRVPRGALSRCKTAKSSDLSVVEVVKPRPKPSSDLGRDLPTRWRARRARLACWRGDG